MTKKIPPATAKRLPLYYRQLIKLKDNNVQTVQSQEFAQLLELDPSTVRRDLSYLGELGVQKVGYNIELLIENIGIFLGQDVSTKAILIGLGNLGTALINYNYVKGNSIEICAIFETNEMNKLEENVNIPVYNTSLLEEYLEENEIKIAILAIPSSEAQLVTDRLVNCGIEGILNFSSTRIKTPDSIFVNNVDLTVELQLIAYYVKTNTKK